VIRVAYHTLGCKVNQYETEKIREALEGAGFETVPFSSAADAYVVNTCSVTSAADGKSRAAVRRALRSNPEAFVVVAGCYAELEPDAIRAIEGVDLVVPNAEKDAIAERIVARFANGLQVRGTASGTTCPGRSTIAPRTRTRAVVKVQDGCDQFCSYCIVPHARNQKSSRPIDEVLREISALAQFGYKEIVLTGIRLGSYGGECGLPELIQAASKVEGIERIRLSSIEPWEVDDALLDAMDCPKVCRHLHIPLQSGDDGILELMNRPYTAERYRQIVSMVRERIPGIGITTDVIVGFPGETDQAFEHTRALIEQIGFSRLHVFRYSARKGTPAALMPDQVSAEVKKLRAENLIELGITAMRRFASSLVGELADVLVEREAAKPNHLTGFTDNYVETRFPGDPALRGQIVAVRIVGVDQDGAIGNRE
jgi:threonylcarbamoyladenosine tRNA methylthiotransferase MtaB